MNMGSVLVLAGLLPPRRLIEYNWGRRSGEAEEEALEEVLRHLAHALERRSEVCLRERMRAAHSRLGPDGQCASIAGVGLFREEGLQGSIAVHPRGDPGVQQVACEEDRAFSRDLLKRDGCWPRRRSGRQAFCVRRCCRFWMLTACPSQVQKWAKSRPRRPIRNVAFEVAQFEIRT